MYRKTPEQLKTIEATMSSKAGKVSPLDEPGFNEFLRRPSISSAVYLRPIGAKDMQAPHLEDETYCVIKDQAKLKVNNQVRGMSPGSILWVQASAERSFFDITEHLLLSRRKLLC